MMVQMLRRTVLEGTGGSLRWQYGITNDLGGKTGTTQANADGWFISISPTLVAGAWVGADDPRIRFRSTELGQGASTALPIVALFYQQLNKDAAYKAITQARFPRIPYALEKELDCPLSKLDMNFWERLFGKEEHKQVRREFGQHQELVQQPVPAPATERPVKPNKVQQPRERKGVLRRLFGKRN